MLDTKWVREHYDELAEMLASRNNAFPLDRYKELDEERRKVLLEVEKLKERRNAGSKEVGIRKKAGEDTEALQNEIRELGEEIKKFDDKANEIESELDELALRIPNRPHASVPKGKDENDNIEMRRWGTPREFDFEPKPHWDLGEALGIMDFDRGVKIAESRFTVLKGAGARLERGLMNFMLDLHTTQHGFTEVAPPALVNSKTMTGTGQLPKFEEDAFKVAGTDYFLIPTAEVPVTNLHRGDILDGNDLPIKYCAYSACFRSEAGSAGRDTRGLIRQHQFNKVELVKFVKPEDSYDELEKLTNDAERILQGLGLPYRVVCLSTGDLGFSSAKTYDIEVWMPSYGRYVEISSCSNFEDFQARRAQIRFRREKNGKPELVHTLNGSGVAIGRTVAAILENYQQPDGSVIVPDALVPYMHCEVIK